MTARLLVFTGKGGVGKTTLALATCKALQNQGKKVFYNSFHVDHPKEVDTLGLSFFDLDLEDSATEYMGRKLHSETVANWIMKTPFFNALFAMIPGLGQMILLGHVLDLLEKDPDLYIVLDSPASGHTLSMFESTHNFHEMFKTGILADDIIKMHRLLSDPNFLEIQVVSLPTEMAIQESKELSNQLIELGLNPPMQWLNSSMIDNEQVSQSTQNDLPEFLKIKTELEKTLREQYKFKSIVPYIASSQFEEIVSMVTPSVQGAIK